MSTLVLDAEALYTEFLAGVRAMYRPGMRLVGVTSGGAWLAERLHKDLALSDGVGIISSSLHRDDFAQRGMTVAAQTQIGFDVNGADIILLDDVLHTGRTIRAVLNELFDFGRPASVKLAVLVDRSGHQLPIQADYFAARVALSPLQSLALARSDAGVFSFNVKER